MKLALLLLGITSTMAIPNGTIRLPIIKNECRAKLNKRSEVHHAKLYNNDGSEYLVNIGIGTPIQNFSVSLDTGRYNKKQKKKCHHYKLIEITVLIYGFLRLIALLKNVLFQDLTHPNPVHLH